MPARLASGYFGEMEQACLRACVGVADRVAYPHPTYSLYDTLVTIQEGVPVRVPYPADFSLPAGLAEAEGRVPTASATTGG